MDEKIRIVCPVCGCVLEVNKIPGLEQKNVTCVKCQHRNPFTAFRVLIEKKDVTITTDENLYDSIGLLRSDDGREYHLKVGKNVIGRKPGNADVQIECATKRMSREHIVIEVVKSEKGYKHFLSLYKEKVNPTYLNKLRLEYGDSIVLNNGYDIILPDMSLRFTIIDKEETEVSRDDSIL
ncbi:MAG: FHA domain-containing protein [Muribaculaceae bacterium]